MSVDTPDGMGVITDIRGQYVFIQVGERNMHYDVDDIFFANGLFEKGIDERDLTGDSEEDDLSWTH
ncbi:MAG: hypothetical protein R3213_09555 [Flavobacteriaceae bacterium]|nr:hypothetical protein [Flavobacteriaceae bacterium]